MANKLPTWIAPALLMLLSVICPDLLEAQCNPCIFTTPIKITNSSYCASVDPSVSYPVPGTVFASFAPGRTATIAPGSGDPGVRTAAPLVMNACGTYMTTFNNVGQVAETFNVRFNSLRDIGTWTFTISGQIEVLTSYCVSGGACGYICEQTAAYPGTEPCVFQYVVDNAAPTGAVNFSPVLTESAADWGKTVTFDGNGADADGGSVKYTWSIVSRPAGALANFTSAVNIRNPTIVFNHEQDIGTWRFRVDIDDDEGERKTFESDLVVPNVKPNITLAVTPGTTMDVLQTLNVSASPVNDVDGGGAFTFNWNVTGPHAYSGPANTSSVSFATTEADITTYSNGTDFRPLWQLACTARDNENATDTKSVTVKVKNKPPVINASYIEEIKVGNSINISTSVLNDEDGGTLTFVWEIIQAPNSAPIGIQNNYSTSSSINIPTTAAYAGTWRFKLTAKDNEGEEKTEKFSILVDAPPVAHITGPTQTIGSLSGFPLTLDGSTSDDPDSKDNCANHCHATSDPPVQVSPGITRYTWFLLEAPEDNPNIFALGRVDDVLGINASSATLEIPFAKRLTPGIYTFQLEVEDAEGNTDTEDYIIDVAEEESKPVAFIIPPYTIQYVDPATNILPSAIAFDGSLSFDMDNLLSSPVSAGISNYEWLILTRPPGCPVTPSLPSGASATTFTLFPAGTYVDPACQGLWTIGLRVTDDDAIAKVNEPVTEATVVIGNCPANLCIDYPTTINPQTIQFSDATDVTIYFHLNSILYTDPAAVFGTIAKVEIYYEGETTPFYEALDPNLFPTDLGGYLMFHWNGYGVGNARPRSGHYHVKMTLLDQSLSTTIGGDYKENAILIQVATPAIAATSDKYVDRDKLQAGTDNVTINYEITGGGTPTALRWRVYDAGNSVVKQGDVPSPPVNGSFNWDGRNNAAALVDAGEYEIELETMNGATSMGKSARYKVTIIQADIDADVSRDGIIDNTTDDMNETVATIAAGAMFNVNYDRDGVRMFAGIPIGDALHINDSGVPGNEDLNIDNAADEADITPFVIRKIMNVLPPSFKVFLKAGSLEDIQSVHVFKKIQAGEAAIWGGLGSRIGNPPVPTEIDITQYVNPADAAYLGDGAGNVQFGLEGLFFRNTGTTNTFDGVVNFTLEVRDGATVVASDEIALKVAPWIMVSHSQPSEQVWVLDHPSNATMRLNASADPGYAGLDASTQMQTTAGVDAASQWIQDHLEIGYYQRPGGVKDHCVFRLPYAWSSGASQPLWPEKRLLGPDMATFQLKVELAPGIGSGDFGGNLEVFPPNAIHKNGKIVIGSRRSPQLFGFLTDQEVQAPFSVNTHWLAVGHVDEIFGFTGNPNEVVIADPGEAYSLMNGIAPANRGKSLFFAKGAVPIDGAVSSNSPAGNRINTGIDHTAGPAWNYIRIYRATASGAQGQVAHIAPGGRHNGYLEIDQVWNTGHQLLPATVGNYGHFIHDSPAPAGATWFNNPQTGDRYVLAEDTRFWETGCPSMITVEEVLADTELRDLNNVDVQTEIDAIRTTIGTQAGMAVNFIKVPTIYMGMRAGFSVAESGEALTPGLANFQSVNGKLYFPRQFGPKNAAGEDLFEKMTVNRVPNAVFTDDWDVYHAQMGEVHCGTNTVRTLPAFFWW